jgi:ribosomal subunit interface protein
MRTNIKVTNMEMTSEIRAYVEKKLDSFTKFLKKEDVLVQCEIGKTTNHHKQGDVHIAEITMSFKGKQFRAVAEEETIFGAIDKVRDDIVAELIQGKDRFQTILIRSARSLKKRIKGMKPWN